MADDDVALLMTQAEYARHRGVSRQAIADLVKKEKLALIERHGRKLIDVAAADRTLGETRERVTLREAPEAEPEAPNAAPRESAGLTKAKTLTEVYRARLAQLEYEEKVGKLLPRDQVEQAASDCGAAILRVLELPLTRLEPLYGAAQKGMSEFRDAMRSMIREQRTRCVQEFAKLAAAAVEADTETAE